MKGLALSALALASCGYTDIELSACFPDCGGQTQNDGGGGEEDLGLELGVEWATPNSVAIRWPTEMIPESVDGYQLSVGALTWAAANDPRLAVRETAHTVVSELVPASSYDLVLRGLRSSDTIIIARKTVSTSAEVTHAVKIFDEGESPARTGFMNQAPPATHQGNDALWFDADGLGEGDPPGLSGLSLTDEGLGNAPQTAFLELWIRVAPSGAALVPFSTRLTAGGTSYTYDALVVPTGPGWHRVQVPTIAHGDEADTALRTDRTTITAFGIDAEWPGGSTIVVDDIRLRY